MEQQGQPTQAASIPHHRSQPSVTSAGSNAATTVTSAAGRISSPARYRRQQQPSQTGAMSVTSSVRSSTILALHPTDDDDEDDDASSLQYSSRDRYYGNGSSSANKSFGKEGPGCISVTDRLWCDTFQPCFIGAANTAASAAASNGALTPRQQQQRQGRMELEQQQLQLKIKELRLLNGKLHARNQTLEAENSAALATALATTTTSDGTVTALQQRCHEAERKNLALQTDLTAAQSQAELHALTSTSLQKQLDEFLSLQQEQADGSTPVTERRADTIAKNDSFTAAELGRLTMALEESEKKLAFVRAEHLEQQQEHMAAMERVQSNLEHAKEQYLETEITLKAQIETLEVAHSLAMATATTARSTTATGPPDSSARSISSENALDTTGLLNERDDTIAKLRQQCLEYSRQLTVLQTQLVEATACSGAPITLPGDRQQQHHVQALELELLRTKESADRQVSDLSASIRELETKYGGMERQLLQAKLDLAAADEVKEQLTEDHGVQLAQLQSEKEQLVQACAAVEQDRDRTVSDLTRQLEAASSGVQAQSTVDEEKDGMISELTSALEIMKASKERLEQEYERSRQTASVPNDSAKVAALEAQVDELKVELQEQTDQHSQLLLRLAESRKKGSSSSSLMVDELRQAVLRSKQTEDALRRQLTMALDEAGTTRQNREVLEEQLNERNATISQLSEQLEQLRQSAATDTTLQSTRGVVNEASLDPNFPLDPAATANDEQQMQRIDDLSSKVKKLKRQLAVSKNENTRLRVQAVVKSKGQEVNKLDGSADTDDTADDDSSTTTASSRRLLKERDDAISSLVKQAMAQDVLVNELRNEITSLKSDQSNSRTLESSSEITVKQLQKEADVFAGQVIELDGEIEQLKSALEIQERKVVELEAQVEEAKRQPLAQSNVLELEAEIDELKEANTTQRNELRDLRRKAWETESVSDEIVRLRNEALEAQQSAETRKTALEKLDEERSKLRADLEEERSNKSLLETQLLDQLQKLEKSCEERITLLQSKLDESRWAFDELKASPGHMSAEGVVAIREEITTLRHDLGNQTAEVDRARATICELEGMLAEKSSAELGAFEEEKEDLLTEIESLNRQLEEARDRIKQLEIDAVIIDEFKAKLERADEAREESEKSIIDAYERKVSLLTLDKDVTIDKLRKELTIEKESNAEELEEVTNQLKVYQLEISDLREEMAEQVARREARIFELEHILAAQEQLVSNMKIEMDHLQGSMEGSAARRKEENDEMQQELLTLTATAAKQEREIQSLQMELNSKTLGHQSEVSKLESKISALEKNPQELRNAHDLQMELRVKEVKDRLEKLKWRNTSLKEENLNLRERLEHAEALAKESADHDRTKALETQLSKQTTKVKTLEAQLKSLKEPPVPDQSSGSNSREPPAGEQVVAEPPVIDPPVQAASPAPASADKKPATAKTAAASPARSGGMLKLFGRKSAATSS